MREDLKQLRKSLAIITLILLSFGLIMVYSSSAIFAWERTGDSAYFLKRHLLFLLVGFVFSFLLLFYDYRKLSKFSKPLMIFALLFLILVLIPGIGKEVAGARRWFRLLGVGF
ncbi:MAG: FtsW/RodA/SpoVE family cell cycle protein, partial [Candidatus Omnitrophota bacterium]